jgi:hypothetical protein
MALLECAANGFTLSAGQAALVAQIVTFGARLQLVNRPRRPAGKTRPH